jgi:asparagine synthetase B (glutamine-hydrolysing)
MVQRGPDGSGTSVAPTGVVGFGHRRLAIIELRDCSDRRRRECGF